MMPGLWRDPLRSVKREGIGSERVKGGEECGEDRSIVEPLINRAARRELLVGPGRQGARRMLAVGRGWLGVLTAMRDFVVDHVHFVVYGGEDRVLAPETGEWKYTGQREAADEKCPAGVRHHVLQSAK